STPTATSSLFCSPTVSTLRAPTPRSFRCAGASPTSSTRSLLHHSSPAAPRQIPVDHHAAEGRQREQQQSPRGVAQQQLPDSEQRPIDQRAPGDPVEQVRQATARGLDLRRERRNRPPPAPRRSGASVE